MIRAATFLLLSVSLLSALERPWPMVDGKTVEVERGFLGTTFRQDGHPVNAGSMYEVLGSHPEAKDAAASAKAWMYPGMGFGAVGGFLMGYTAVQPLVGGKFNAPLFYAGLGSAAVGVLFGKVSEGKLVQAVGAYNGSQGKTGIQWHLAPGGAGAVLAFEF